MPHGCYSNVTIPLSIHLLSAWKRIRSLVGKYFMIGAYRIINVWLVNVTTGGFLPTIDDLEWCITVIGLSSYTVPSRRGFRTAYIHHHHHSLTHRPINNCPCWNRFPRYNNALWINPVTLSGHHLTIPLYNVAQQIIPDELFLSAVERSSLKNHFHSMRMQFFYIHHIPSAASWQHY